LHALGYEVVSGRWHRTDRVARVGQQLGELPGEERMTVGAAVHLGCPALGSVIADGVRDEVEHLLRSQSVQLDHLSADPGRR
jgi:hypothetical protein